MPQYITFEDVRIRLLGKVRFTEDEEDENKMQITLAERLIEEAEGQVELDLSPRYHAPFSTMDDGPFADLPAAPTKNILRTMCELMSVKRILETDFGRGSVADAEKYIARIEKRYNAIHDQLLKMKTSGGVEASGWMYPPLIGLKLSYQNAAADDGFIGSVYVTGQNDGDYPQKQINDPSESFYGWRWDD